jgi:hypothetical protein
MNNSLCNVKLPIYNLGCDGKSTKTELSDKQINRDMQANELQAADIPAETKRLIAIEYDRLCKQHPNWKAHRLMRKAGEKYNVKFEFE